MKEFVGKKVLMLLENSSYPQDNRVRREATTLISAGYKVTVICSASKDQPGEEIIDGVKVFRYSAPPDGEGFLGYLIEYGISLVATFMLSLKIFFRDGFDILHAHNPPDIFVFLAMFYKMFGKRFVFDHHDLSPEMYDARFLGEGNRIVYKALLYFEKISFKFADHVISTNKSYKNIAKQRGGVSEEDITIVRNGPELTRVKQVEPDLELRARASTIIGYVGVMGFQDGVDYLIRSLYQLVEMGRDDFYCVIIGKGDAIPQLKKMTNKLNLDPYIWFTGRIPDYELMIYLSTTDICVVPDPGNPFTEKSTMIKMMEYMALSKPIVAFDLHEHNVTAQGAAVYATPNDELDFARKLAWLIDHPERRLEMGKLGRKRIEHELAWSHQKDDLLEAYSKLSGSNKKYPQPAFSAKQKSP